MLYEFRFKNFRSYKSEAGIDFTAKPISEFKNTLIKADDKTLLLPVCAVFGPNGGGKSGVLFAFRFLGSLVTEPLAQVAFMKSKNEKLSQDTADELQSLQKSESLSASFYKWDEESGSRPSEFSVLYKVNGSKYRYELSMLRDHIVQENLYREDLRTGQVRAVFERDTEEVYLCEEIQGMDVENINESLPLLSYIAMFKNIEMIDDAIGFFMTARFINFDIPTRDRKVPMTVIENHKDRILSILMSMGIDICDLIVERDSGGKVKEVYTRHRLCDGKRKDLRFQGESSGTRKIFSILPFILNTLDKGALLLVDELDAKLHPLLLQRIIEMFTDRAINKKGAQLLFTSHDLTTMSNKVFRRDEIWFSALNGYDESVLYSLADFRKENGDKPRNDENYNKQYLEGRYGADPYMHRILNWGETQCP